MTTLIGYARDFAQVDLENYQGRVSFIPSGPGVRASENAVLASRVITTTLDVAGRFEVDLAATTAVTPDVWFLMRLDWFQKDPLGLLVPVGLDILPWEIRVPSSGTPLNITDLIERPLGQGEIWESDGPENPPNAHVGDYVYDSSTGLIHQLS